MNYMNIVLPVVLIGLGLAYRSWITKKSATALANAGPAYTAFFERTGYRYADMANQPPAAQTARAMADVKNWSTGGFNLHYVRDFYGIPIHYTSSAGHEKRDGQNVYVIANQWDAELAAPPRVPIHIADKRLDSTLKAAREMFGNTKRIFNPKCSQRVTTGVPAIDQKFVVFGEDPAAVQQLFAANPGLVQLLSGWEEVDISVTGSRAVFADPVQKNMQAAMGGMIGNMAMGLDYAKRTELSIPVHDRVAELMATLVRAAS